MSLRINYQSLACIIAVFCLAGCEFTPVYDKQANATAAVSQFGGVAIDPVSTDADKNRLGQEFRIKLEDILNANGVVPPNPAYRLRVNLAINEVAIGVSRDGTVSRYNVYLVSNYTLIRTSDEKVINSGSLKNVSSYNNLANTYYSTYVSQQDASKEGISELAELYRMRLAAYFNEGAPVQSTQPVSNNLPPAQPVTPYSPYNPLSKTGYPYP